MSRMKYEIYADDLNSVIAERKAVRANYGKKILEYYNPEREKLNVDSKKFKEMIKSFYEEEERLNEESLRLYRLMDKAICNKE